MSSHDYQRMLRGEITTQEYCDLVAMEVRRQESRDYYRQFKKDRDNRLFRMVAAHARRIAQIVRSQ